MIPILDFQQRSLTGPVMKNDDFDLALARKMRQILQAYPIKYNSEELVVDDATADAVFEAGVELLADIGLYHIDTYRVIQLTRGEVLEIARDYRENHRKQVFGKGKEEFCIEYRTGQDSRPPVLQGGGGGGAQEEWHIAQCQSFAQEETNRGMGVSGGIASIGGIVPKSGTLTEVYAGLWETRALLEALRRAGRDGMHLGVLATVYTVGGVLAVLNSGLREPHNTQIGIHIMPEQKVDWTRLICAYVAEDRGYVPWTSAMSTIGGMCGGPNGAAVGLVANMLGQLAYGHGTVGSFFTSHLDGHSGTREALWTYSAAARAAERHIHVPVGGASTGHQNYRSTEVGICQQAATTIAQTASGMAYQWVAGATGLEVRITGDILNGVAGMPREKVNDVLNRIMAKVDELMEEIPALATRKRFPDMYDVKTVRPKPEYAAMCSRVTEELARLGVPYSGRLVIT